jgi:peptide/nickel transport system permease protein
MTTVAGSQVSVRRQRWRRQLGRTSTLLAELAHRPSAIVGIGIFAVFVAFALIPWLFTGPLESVLTASGTRLESPSFEHILGTDEVGRDVFNLVVHGARISLFIGVTATLASIILGTIVGMTAGLAGGGVDDVLMRITDVFLVIPVFLLAIVLAPIILELVGVSGTILGFRVTSFVTIFVIAIGGWAFTARVVRSQTLSLRERVFVDRVRVIGASHAHIMRRHILPNVLPIVVTMTVLGVSGAILAETALSFIGLGDPFQPSWGQLLSSAQQAGAAGSGAWWYLGAPGVCIALVMLSCTLIGRALDDVINPKLAARK